MSDFRKVQADGSAVALENVGKLAYSIIVTSSITLTKEQSGSTVYVGVDGLIVTAPDVVGCEFTFINTGNDGAVALRVSTVNDIIGTVANAAADSVLASGEIVNTKATANTGDYITLRRGVSEWYVVGGVGIWADA